MINNHIGVNTYMLIYKTTNQINGKIYVGQDSKDNPDYLGSGIKLKNAIKKYGRENFIKESICTCTNHQILDELEIYWIDKLNSRNPAIGYNIHQGGQHFRDLSGTTRDKISKTLTGRTLSKETCDKMSKSRSGVNHWTNGRKFSDEHKRKLSEAHMGKTVSEETKKKQSVGIKKAWKIRPKPEVTGNKNPFYGKSHSDEFKKRRAIEESNKRWVVNVNGTCKRILLDELQKYINLGYKRGRKWKLNNDGKN